MIIFTREEAQEILNALECATPPTFSPKLVEEWHKAGDVLRAKLIEPDDVPKWVYQKAVPEGTEAHHWAVVMHDMDKTVEGWSEDVKMYYDGKLIAPQPEPEPVAKMREMLEVQGRDGTWNYSPYLRGIYNGMEFMLALVEDREPVYRDEPDKYYTAPPQREWVGLTDDEISDVQQQFYKLVTFYDKDFAHAIEAKLKEKNE